MLNDAGAKVKGLERRREVNVDFWTEDNRGRAKRRRKGTDASTEEGSDMDEPVARQDRK